MRYLILCFSASILFVLCNQAIANEQNSYLTLAIGHVATFDSDIDEPAVVKVEYRMPSTSFWDLSPGIGLGQTQGGASFIFAFAEKDFDIADNWKLSANFGLGSFRDGKDVQLGKELEFRSGVRMAYQFKNDVRLGVELFHLSNGGLGDRNPGTEPAFISIFIPF